MTLFCSSALIGGVNDTVFCTVQIVWDVGHQAYGHKILTGRRSRMPTIRQTGGLSGMPCSPCRPSVACVDVITSGACPPVLSLIRV